MSASNSSQPPILRISGVQILRGGRKLLLPDLQIIAGDRIALVGPNGSGKSTLCLVVAGLLRVPSGVYRSDAMQRLTIGYLPQGGGLYPNLTILQNIEFQRRLYGHREDFDPRVVPMLWTLGLESELNKQTRSLSGGFFRLASLACVLSLDADVLVLDEPMAGLDDEHREAAIEAIETAADKVQFLVVTGHRASDVPFCRTVVEVKAENT